VSVQILLDAGDRVGESPVWDEGTQQLYWVDIVRKKIRAYRLGEETQKDWSAPDFPTALAMKASGAGAIVALAGGIYLWNGDQEFDFLVKPDPFSDNRLNEGKCDPSGRFWVGSMQTNLTSEGTHQPITANRGALFRYDGRNRVERLTAHEFGISNTMAWSPDNRYFFCADTIRNTLLRYDYHPNEGLISNPVCWGLERLPGAPDGSCIDHDGCLWNARFGGSCLVRITPEGKLDEILRLPVTNPTSCTFGGRQGKTLFITSARFSLTPEQLARNPQEGALLAVDLNVGGEPERRFRGAV
jgi:sugar lactone lactonase YvrE